jgi:hypothetical protein
LAILKASRGLVHTSPPKSAIQPVGCGFFNVCSGRGFVLLEGGRVPRQPSEEKSIHGDQALKQINTGDAAKARRRRWKIHSAIVAAANDLST